MKKKVEVTPVKGWQGAIGLISECSMCGKYLDGKTPAYWQKIATFADGFKTRIACRTCADK